MVELREEVFGITDKSEQVLKYTWQNQKHASVSVISYGATIQAIKIPDNNGVLKDVVLGFDDLNSYVNRNSPYLGATVGRCANRIGYASFTIDGVTYNLAKNIGEHHLHGGIIGFNKANWKPTVVNKKVVFSHLSPDGDEGYPGDVLTTVSYEFTEDSALKVEFLATSTKKTVVNLTNHAYFNLDGHESGAAELYNHVVVINADRITETDENSIPTGRLLAVGGTPFELRVATRIGDVINQQPNLFDDNFCVTNYGQKDLNFVSRVVHPSSGRYLEVYSDQPGVQFYTSNFLPSPSEPALIGKAGEGYRRHGAFCLETQTYPDAVHHQNFPSSILVPGNVYKHRVVYRFGVDKTTEPRVVSL